MNDDLNLSRAVGKYVLYLCTSLLVATVVGLFLGGSPEPRTPERLGVTIVFFTTFTLFFVWDAGYLHR